MVHATAKGGFLAPTRAWLLHMGEKIDYEPKVGKERLDFDIMTLYSLTSIFLLQEGKGRKEKTVLKAKAKKSPEEDANGDQKEPAKKPSFERPTESRKPKSPPPTVAKKPKSQVEDPSRPKGATAPANGMAAPPATLPKPSVSAEFMLQARRPKVPALDENGDDAGDGVKGKADLFGW